MGKKVMCNKDYCKHMWEYRGSKHIMLYITCPRCLGNIRLKKAMALYWSEIRKNDVLSNQEQPK